ncbi:MAG: hypothetical protein WAK26_18340 [Terracidiphilus sp.]
MVDDEVQKLPGPKIRTWGTPIWFIENIGKGATRQIHNSTMGDIVIRKLLVIFATITLAATLFAGQKHEFQTGKLLNVTTSERLVEGTSVLRAIFTVQIGDIIYTARGERVHHRSGDIGQGLIVGDTVKVTVDGDDLILLKPDGKDLKIKIVRRERAQ